MREVIAQVMDAEAEANRISSVAAKEAIRIRDKATEEAHLLSIRLGHETQEAVNRILAESAADTQCRKQELLAQYSRDLSARLCLDDKALQAAVTFALQCLCPDNHPP